MGKRMKRMRIAAVVIVLVMLVNSLPFGTADCESVEAAGTTETTAVPEMPDGNKNYADYMYTNCSGDTKFENGKAYSTSTTAEPRVRFDMDSNWDTKALPFTKDDTYVFGFDLVTTETKDGVAYQSARAILGAVNDEQLTLQFRGDSITLFSGIADQKWSVPFTRELGKSYRIDILVEPNAVSVWVDGSLEVGKKELPVRTEMRTGIMFSYAIAEVTNIDLYYTEAEDFSDAPKLPEMPSGNRNYADYMLITGNQYYTFANGALTSVSETNAAAVTFDSLPFGTTDTYVYGFNLTTETAEANWKSVRIILGKIKDGETEKTLRMYFMGDTIGLYKNDNDIWTTRFNRSFGETYRVDMLVTPNAVSLWIDHVYVATVNFSDKTAATTGVQFEYAKASLSDIALYYANAENTALKLVDIDGVDYTYDYLKDGKFTLLSNTQIFQDNAVRDADFDEINICATMTYPADTASHGMLSGFYLGGAKRSVNGESKGNADIYIGYLPVGYNNTVINEIVLWDGGYDFVISSGGRMTNILPAEEDLNGEAITYQINYKESTDTLTFRITSGSKSAQWKLANVTTVISNGRENGSTLDDGTKGKNTYSDFQWNLGLGLDKYAGNESIEVSNIAVWGDVTAKDILIVEDGTESYPVIFCVEEGDTLPTKQYLEQTLSIDGQDMGARHYITGWKDSEGHMASVYEAGKTYQPEFIDTKMLDIHVQYKKDEENSTAAEEKLITRFIGSVNKLEGYKEAGFILSTNERTLEPGQGYKDITGITTVYAGLYENTENGSVYRETKNIYDAYSKYVFAYDIGNMPTGQKIYARAYVELTDGTIVLGNVQKIMTGENNMEKLKETLKGKKLSILGDSISTYTGYSNNAAVNSTTGDNAICYDGNYILKSVDDTWWMQAINETGMSLLVNNSYSGDRVHLLGQQRNQQLHADTGELAGTNPDIIAVYLGINDFNGNHQSVEEFSKAYDQMISALVKKYNKADVFLFNLVPNKGMGRSIADLEAFNEVIEKTAETYHCTLVDLYHDSGMSLRTCYRYTGDGLHPNALGMDLLTNVFIDAMIEKY